MKKRIWFINLNKIVVSALGFSVLTIFLSVNQVYELDPGSDFTFSFPHHASAHSYRLISYQEVEHILLDRAKGIKPDDAKALARHLIKLCEHYRFDPAFVLTLIRVESNFRVRAMSRVGARGLMQVTPFTAKYLAHKMMLPYAGPKSLFNPFYNITLGIHYLSELRDRYRGFAPHFLAAYQIGPARFNYRFSRNDYRPVESKRYFRLIRKFYSTFRFYSQTDGSERV